MLIAAQTPPAIAYLWPSFACATGQGILTSNRASTRSAAAMALRADSIVFRVPERVSLVSAMDAWMLSNADGFATAVSHRCGSAGTVLKDV